MVIGSRSDSNEPIPATTTTRLCDRCGYSLKLKLRVSSFENLNTFRTGFVPSDDESAFISRLIEEAQEDMVRYNKELDHLRATATIIMNKQKTLATYIGDLTYVVSPIRKIPPEILGEIFTYLCCSDVGTNDLSAKVPFIPTVTLTQVCFRWKTLVKSMPSLWSSISFQHSLNGNASYRLLRFIDASKANPLDFKVLCSHITEEDLELFMRHSHRWRSVEFYLPHKRMGKEVFHTLSMKDTDLPQLISLRVGLGPDDDPRDSELPVGCAKLRSVTLNGFNLNLLYPRPSIQVLKLTNLPATRIFHLIQNSPNVQQITLCQCRSSDGLLPQLTSDVRELQVDYYKSTHEVEDDFFENMTMPRLTSLKLLDGSFFLPYNDAPILSMLKRSSCPLTHLSIGITLTDDQVLAILPCVPNVTHLELCEFGNSSMVTDSLLRKLTVTSVVESVAPESDKDSATQIGAEPSVDATMADGDGPVADDTSETILLPSLVDLVLNVQPTCRDDVLLDFVRSRWKPASPTFPVLGDGNTRGEVACLRRLGLKRATGALFDGLRKSLEEIGKEGLAVSF